MSTTGSIPDPPPPYSPPGAPATPEPSTSTAPPTPEEDNETIIDDPEFETFPGIELPDQIPLPLKIGAGIVLFLSIASRIIPNFRTIFFTTIWTSIITFILLVLLTVFTVQKRRSNETASHPLKNIKPLAFTRPARFHAALEAIRKEESFVRAPLYPPSQKVSDAIDEVIDLILNSFINEWYQKITPDPAFKNQVEKTIRHALYALWTRAEKLDLVEIAVGRVVPLLTTHLSEFASAEKVVRGKHLNKQLTESEELDMAVASKYRDGRLHAAVQIAYTDSKTIQQDYLRKIITKVLPLILPEKEMKSRAVSVLVREIMSCSVLLPVITLMSDPDFWNRTVETLGRGALQERKTVRKLRAALEQHTSPKTKLHKRLTPKADERTFERFIRTIRNCNSLPDAKRMRNEITIQLRKDADFQDQVYLKRLETAKKLLDQKVAHLSSGPKAPSLPAPISRSGSMRNGRNGASGAEQHTLLQILKSPSGITSFMEYMDRQNRIKLVQFWMVVDGLRNPLEDDPASDEESVPSGLSWTSSDRNDIGQIYEAYISIQELKIPDKSRHMVRKFLKAGKNASNLQYYQARGSILRAQTAVYEDMQEHDLPGFKSSDLFYNYSSSRENRSQSLDSPRMGPQSSNSLQVPEFPEGRRGSLQFKPSSSSDKGDLFTSRHSHEEKRSKLFDDDWGANELSQSRGSLKDELFSEGSVQEDPVSPSNGVVEAMEAVLNHIMEERPSVDESRKGSTSKIFDDLTDNPTPDSGRSSGEISRPASTQPIYPKRISSKKATSLATLGLVNDFASKSVFAGEEIFAEENAKALEDQGFSSDPASDYEDAEVHEAAPGDLGLAEAISDLNSSINKLYSQEAVVSTMLKKAELTNNTAELRILNKSRASLQREIRRKELQRQQYIIQESDNSLYGRASISIKQPIVGNEQGKEYAIYIVEVYRKAGDQFPAAEWGVARRYSEFFQLHQELRAKYASVKHLEFPRKHVVMKLQKDFLDKRRAALEVYLRGLLLIPDVCKSRELRAFLSQQSLPPIPDANATDGAGEADFISKLYNSIADGMGDVIGTVPMFEQLTAAASSIAGFQHSGLLSEADSSLKARTAEGGEVSVAEAEAELIAYENKEDIPFVKPICDLFLEVFELNKGSSWLKGRAVVVVLHQLLGGTIERKVREQVKGLTNEGSIERYIHMLRDSLWADKSFIFTRSPRTTKEKSRSRTEASLMLATLLPDLAANVVGRSNASNASRRLFAVFNNERLNCHMAFMILDTIIDALFPELRQ
ncbi:Intermediate filament protein [Arthrobotrys musiformis]|uniref:Intermediate filament protein n=1 Tax=Arthrobotrys musiformis TaxID=47236 RepID=A0AAV9WNN2_9PEZI